MKIRSTLFFVLLLSASLLLAGNDGPVFTDYFVGKRLDTVHDSTRCYFSLADSGAVLINLVLSSDTDWEECRNVSAILDVCTDQNPLTIQSVITYNGRKQTEYARYLWELGSGEHFVDLVFRPKKSSPVAKFIKIESIKIAVIPPNDPYYWPCVLCPYVNTYKDYSQNDIPLLVYYEEWLEGATKRYLYSIVFSHDDGHSDDFQDWEQMKTLDRASSIDIEWMYDVSIKVSNDSLIFLKKLYQGASHATRDYWASMRHYHPELSVCTENNNFATGIDKGKFPQFLPPIKLTTDLYSFLHPYIEKHPEVYTTWVKEMRRDHGMYNFNCKNDMALWTFYYGYIHDPEGFTNTDPVYHLFFEYELANNSGMEYHISVKVKNDEKWYGRYVLNNNGRHWQSIVLPEATIRLENIDTLRISGRGKIGTSTEFRIARIWYFDENINLISHHVNFPVMQKISTDNPEKKYAVRDLFSNELTLHECKISVAENTVEFILPFLGDINGNASATVNIKTFAEANYTTYAMKKQDGFFSLQMAKSAFPLVYDLVILGADADGVSGYVPQYLQDIDFIKLTSVEKNSTYPERFSLNNYPNPFNNATTIQFSVPQTTHVTLEVYNSLGQLVETLCDGFMSSGTHHIPWNAIKYGCGIYYTRLKTDQGTISKKILYLK
jgi:hypothetical protein